MSAEPPRLPESPDAPSVSRLYAVFLLATTAWIAGFAVIATGWAVREFVAPTGLAATLASRPALWLPIALVVFAAIRHGVPQAVDRSLAAEVSPTIVALVAAVAFVGGDALGQFLPGALDVETGANRRDTMRPSQFAPFATSALALAGAIYGLSRGAAAKVAAQAKSAPQAPRPRRR